MFGLGKKKKEEMQIAVGDVAIPDFCEKDKEDIKDLAKKEAAYLNKATEIDDKLISIQRSTATSIPRLSALHNYCRMRWQWYYRWHLKGYSSSVHWALLVVYMIIVTATVSLGSISGSFYKPKEIIIANKGTAQEQERQEQYAEGISTPTSLVSKDTSGVLKAKEGEAEVVSDRTESFKKYRVGSSNEFRSVGAVEPIHYRDDPFSESGVLKEIDLTIEQKNSAEDGDYSMDNNGYQAKFWNNKQNSSGDVKYVAQFRRAGKFIEMAPVSLIYENANGDRQVISTPQNSDGPSIDNNDYTITWKNVFGEGIDFRYNVSTTKFFKTVIINSKDNLPAPEIDQTGLQLKVIMSVSWDDQAKIDENFSEGTPVAEVTSTDATSVQIDQPAETSETPVTEPQNNEIQKEAPADEVLTDATDIAYKDSSNRDLWWIASPKAWDSSGEQKFFDASQDMKREGNNVYAEIGIDKSVLDTEGLSFPFYIDAVMATEQIAANSDDCYGLHAGVSITDSTTIYFGWNMGVADTEDAGFRFTTVPIPAGATITSSTMTYKAAATDATAVSAATIYGDDVDSASTWTNAHRPNNITQTAASVPWTPGSWTLDTDYASPDITTIVQEIVSRGGWASNNNMAYAIIGAGSGASNKHRRPYAYNASAANSAKLDASYTVPGITISGTVYTAENDSTNVGANKTIALSVNGAAKTTVETTAGGAFSFTPITVNANDTITIFEDDEGAEETTYVTQTLDAGTNITGLKLYNLHVSLSHQSVGPMTNTLLATADNCGDDDIKYTMAGSNVTFIDGFKVYVVAAKTYTPGATVAAHDFEVLASSATFNPAGNAVTISGSWKVASAGVFTSSGTVTFSAAAGTETIDTGGTDASHDFTNLTKSTGGTVQLTANAISISGTLTTDASTVFDINGLNITAVTLTNNGTFKLQGAETVTITNKDTTHGTILYSGTGSYASLIYGDNYYNLTFDGSGGTFTAAGATTAIGADLTVTNGTLNGTHDITISGGDATGNGTVTMTGGTFLIDGDGNFGGDTNWTFYNLTFGNGAGATATTKTGTDQITVTSVMTIAASQTLNAGDDIWVLSGTGSPFVKTGTFTCNTSIIKYTGSGAVNVVATTYNNLETSSGGSADSWTVSSAGDAAYNGHYYSAGTYLGKAYYTMGSGGSLRYLYFARSPDPTDSWRLNETQDADLSNPMTNDYYLMSSTPPGAYSVGTGTVPAPTVAAYTTSLYTLASGTITVGGSYIIGNGTNPLMVDVDTNDTILDLNGSFEMKANATFTASATAAFNLAGNFTNVGGGTFIDSGATVTLDGGSAQIVTTGGNDASHNFYNLTVTNSAGPANGITFADDCSVTGTFNDNTQDSKLTFTTTKTFAWANIDIDGAAGHNVVMTSTNASPGTPAGPQWFFNVIQAVPTVSYVTAYDSDANGGSEIIATNNCTDGHNNEHWMFTSSVDVTGTVYTAENKSTNIGANKTIALSINGAAATTVETGAGGTFSFGSVTLATNATVAVYVSGESEKGSLITQAANDYTDIAGLEVYTSHIALSYLTAGPMTNVLLATADNVSDADLLESVDVGNAVTFTAGNIVWIVSGKTYTPGGTVSAGSITIAGTFTPEANTVTLNDFGTPFVNNGTFNEGTSTIIYAGSGATNVAASTYSNLKVNHAAVIFTASGSTTVSGVFTIQAGTFDASNSTIYLSGSGTPFVVSGTFAYSTSTVKYTGTGATNIAATDYYILESTPASGGPTHTFAAGTVNVHNNYTIGDGANAVTVDADANDPIINIDGIFEVKASGTFIASATAAFSVASNFTNAGTFTHSSGTVTFDGQGIQSINAGSSNLNNVTVTNTADEVRELAATTIAGTLSINASAVYDINGQNITLTTLDNNGTFRLQGGETTVTITNPDTDTGIVEYDGGGSYSLLKYGDVYKDVKFTGAGSWMLGAAMVANGTMTLSNGTFDTKAANNFAVTVAAYSQTNGTFNANGSAITSAGDFTISNGTFNADTSTVILDMTSQVISLSIGSKTLHNIEFKNNSAVTGRTLILSAGTYNLSGDFLVNAANNANVAVDASANPTVNVAGNIDYTGAGAGSESIIFGSGTWNVGGSIDFTGGTATLTGSSINMDSSATGKTITSNSQIFNNLTFNHATGGWSFADAASVAGTLTITNSDTVGNGVNFNNQAITLASNLSMTAGKLTMGSSLVSIAGNWDVSGGTVVPGTSTVTFGGTSGTKTIASGGQSFNNIAFNDGGGTATYQPTTAMDVNGTFILTDGIFNLGLSNPTLNIADDITINGGSVVKGTGLVNFDGDLAYDDNVGSVNFGNVKIGHSPDTTTLESNIVCDSLVIDGGDILITQGYDIDSGGGITITGTLNATHDGAKGGVTNINLTGSWDATNGTFTADNSNVTFDGSGAQNITSHGESFNNLIITNADSTNGITFADSATVTGIFMANTGDSKITFHAAATYAFANISLSGTAGHNIRLISSTSGTPWLFNVPAAAPAASYVTVSDSNAAGGSTIDATNNGVNGGGNTNWLFSAANIVITPASATLDKAGTQAFTAKVYDTGDYEMPTAVVTWSVVSGGGSITPLGVFTAGSTAGTFTNTVRAFYAPASGYATIVVNDGAIPPTPEPTPTPTPGEDTGGTMPGGTTAGNSNTPGATTGTTDTGGNTTTNTGTEDTASKSIISRAGQSIKTGVNASGKVLNENKPIVAGAVAATAVFALINSGISLIAILATTIGLKTYFLLLLNYLLCLFHRKRKGQRGVVYDRETNQPVAGALVNLYKSPEMRQVASAISDKDGSYFFIADKGEYTLSVKKAGYFFPIHTNRQLADVRELYIGQTIEIKEKSGVVNIRIPVEVNLTDSDLRAKSKLIVPLYVTTDVLRIVFLVAGSIASILILAYSPIAWNYILSFGYVILWLLEYRNASNKIHFSRVIDSNDKKPVDLAMVRTMTPEGKLAQTSVSDILGRFLPYITASGQKISIQKPGYAVSEITPKAKEFVEGKKFYINKNVQAE